MKSKNVLIFKLKTNKQRESNAIFSIWSQTFWIQNDVEFTLTTRVWLFITVSKYIIASKYAWGTCVECLWCHIVFVDVIPKKLTKTPPSIAPQPLPSPRCSPCRIPWADVRRAGGTAALKYEMHAAHTDACVKPARHITRNKH